MSTPPDPNADPAEVAARAAKTQQGRPAWLKRVPDLHGKPGAEQDWSVHLG